MRGKTMFPKLALIAAIFAVMGLQQAAATLIVDRGLPTANLNSAAGVNRSNVAWDFNPPENYISGDDFTLGMTANKWRIDKIRVWAIAGNTADVPPFELGDRYDTISLFLGSAAGASIDRVKTASILSGGNLTDNADVVISPVTYSTGADYQGSSGDFIQIWQIDFNNLGLFNAGMLMFGVDGMGLSTTLPDKNWFNHSSNAALSGSPQDDADDQMRWYTGNASDTSVAFGDIWDSNGFGWDKSSDNNIQVFATAVPEPATLALLGLALAGLGATKRRRGN